MENWYAKFEEQATEALRGTKQSDLRFFRVEEYFRNAKRVDEFAGSCRECYGFRKRIDESVAHIKTAVHTPGRERKQLDQLQSDINEHLKKAHGFFPPNYHTYMQSVYWTIGFMALAYVLTLLFPEIDRVVFYSPAFVIGVFIGQFKGGRKDRKIRESEKIL